MEPKPKETEKIPPKTVYERNKVMWNCDMNIEQMKML